MENNETKKISKLAVVVFILALFGILGIVVGGAHYAGSIFEEVANGIFSVFFIWLAYFAKKYVVKHNLKGIKITHFAFWAFIVLFVLKIVFTFMLAPYHKSLAMFAKEQTPTFFVNNFTQLRENSTEELKRVLGYETNTEDLNKKFAEIGPIKECAQEIQDVNEVSYGIQMYPTGVEFGMSGLYSARCYGENKPFDFFAMAKYQNGKWLIDQYQYDVELNKNFDAQNNVPGSSEE